ncbi:MAG TPA: serine/threonine-protein kinase [Blastocatellia bacterium]|nr:serine/threonine-protein kinase [Blastocatellia bacterium]
MAKAELIGEVLDEKYRIERELGKGGMGSVYLATHLGTGRPVAVKVITPQFMMNDEFIERFKREAKAAGRLYHPNVVNVTDFGFAHVEQERIAYLVMEYLDGCTLAEVLAEESSLPIDWVVDIVEQTSSAIDEAHQQGIVHRDLKPDNIWLEPNRRGGYTVKVLDFGLAKLGDVETAGATDALTAGSSPTNPSSSGGDSKTLARSARTTQVVEVKTFVHSADGSESATQIQAPTGEDATLIQVPSRENDATLIQVPSGESDATLIFADKEQSREPVSSEAATRIIPGGTEEAATLIQPAREPDQEPTRVKRQTTAENLARQTVPADGLTRVGSILGTPIYMSPEQCRSEPLDARSDIYSLGVIAYQMLAGAPPFAGTPFELMKLHIEATPPPLRDKRKKMPKRMAAVVMSALAKNPADRSASAAGFSSALRATSDGAGALLRRAFALYIEHFPKFFRFTFLTYLPLMFLHAGVLVVSLMKATAEVPRSPGSGPRVDFSAPTSAIEIILSVVMFILTFFINAFIIGVTIRLVTQLYLSPLRPLQLRTAYLAVKKRLKPLLLTTVIAGIRWGIGLILLVIPGVIMFINYSLASPVVMMEGLKGRAALKRSKALVKRCWRSVIAVLFLQWAIPAVASSVFALPVAFALRMSKAPHAPLLTQRVTAIIVAMLSAIIVPLIATLTALLYLKARQIGGETMREVLSQFEEEDAPRTKWQMRMRERLQTTSKTSYPQ